MAKPVFAWIPINYRTTERWRSPVSLSRKTDVIWPTPFRAAAATGPKFSCSTWKVANSWKTILSGPNSPRPTGAVTASITALIPCPKMAKLIPTRTKIIVFITTKSAQSKRKTSLLTKIPTILCVSILRKWTRANASCSFMKVAQI